MIQDEVELFKIGHSPLAQTKIPTFCEIIKDKEGTEGLYLVDSAGVNDPIPKDEFAN